MGMHNLKFWVIGIRKKECIAFERRVRKPELFINQKALSNEKKKKTLSVCILAKQNKKTQPQLKFSYNLHIKKAYVLSATWIS